MDLYELTYLSTPTMTVTFSLAGDDLNPDQITSKLGISPSKAWSKGEPIPREKGGNFVPRASYPFGRWMLHAPCSKYDDFQTQINALLAILEICPSDINDLVSTYNGEISIAYSSDEDHVGFHLDKTLIQRIYSLGVEIDIIIYPVCNEDE